MMPGESNPSPRGRTVDWAVFLAMSWTWCIGMFLPILLMRDHGRGAWLAFALPNVLGAAALPWFLDRRAAGQWRREHAQACAMFSVVTILFHVAFLNVAGRLLADASGWVLPLAILLPLVWGRRLGAAWIAAWCTVLTAAFLWAARTAVFPTSQIPFPETHWVAVAGLAPALAFGFLLCPYLDLTFLRARHNMEEAASRKAFAVGFGGLFLAVLVFTYLYARPVLTAMRGEILGPAPGVVLVAAYMILQSGLTVGLHLMEVREASRQTSRFSTGDTLYWLAGIAGIALVYLLPRLWDRQIGTSFGVKGWEGVYWTFMAFYGAFFPGYVWIYGICVGRAPRGVRQWAPLVLGFLVSTPMLWAGFVGGRTLWVVPGVAGILLLGPLCRRYMRQG